MTKPKIRTAELAQLAKRIYEETLSGNKVAQRLDISHSAAYRLLKDAGVELPDRHGAEIQQRKKSLQGDVVQQVAADYAAGISMRALQKKYEVGAWAIRTAVRDAGVEQRPRGQQPRKYSNEDIQEMVRLYESDWSQAQIAAQFGTHQTTVSIALAKAGCKQRRYGARGADHGSWKGGRVKIGNYVGVYVEPNDPMFCMAHNAGYVLEHRLIMARALGRPLTDDETVHHIDGDTSHNRLPNLQLRFGKHGKGVVMVCNHCGSHDVGYWKLPDA